jgi:hypothetical protein
MSDSRLKILRVLRARKRKFGFESPVLTSNFVELSAILEKARSLDTDLLFELNFNMSANEFKLYTDKQDVADYIKEHFCKTCLHS